MVTPPKTGEKSPSHADKVRTTAHLIATVGNELGHTTRHIKTLDGSKTPKQKALNQSHAEKHLKSAVEHTQKLMDHLTSNYPAEGKELSKLEDTIARPTVKQRIQSARKKVEK